MLDLRRLRLLKEFAGRGTIAATAAALGYTPSAVSQQLAALEREAGVILLDRTARSAELTDACCCRLAVHAERILAQVEEAEAELSAAEREPSGRVSVAAFPTAAAAFAPALARSLRAHPALTLLLRQTQRDEGLNSVRWGEADVALVDDWTGLAHRGAGVLQFYPLVRDPLVLVVPRGHPLADPAEPVDLRKLSQTSRWMAAPAGKASRQATDQLLAAAGGAPAMPWEFEGLGTILSLVSRGIGVAAVPRLRLGRLRGPGRGPRTARLGHGPRRVRGGPDGQRAPPRGGRGAAALRRRP